MKQPTLEGLRDLLLDKSKWPEGFRWNYSCQGSCALGLGVEYFLEPPKADSVFIEERPSWHEMRTQFLTALGLDFRLDHGDRDRDHIFFHTEVGVPFHESTPQQVAGWIDDVIVKRKKVKTEMVDLISMYGYTP